MAKINICDICYNDKTTAGTLTRSTHKISCKDGKGMRVALDSCSKPEHLRFFKGFTSFQKAREKYERLLSGKWAGVC